MSGDIERFDEWAEGVDVRGLIDTKNERISELEAALVSLIDAVRARDAKKIDNAIAVGVGLTF